MQASRRHGPPVKRRRGRRDLEIPRWLGGGVCYSTTVPGGDQCPATPVMCERHSDAEECGAETLRDGNRTLLACAWVRAPCRDECSCAASGECSDWAFKSFAGMPGAEPTCVIPWAAADATGAPDAAHCGDTAGPLQDRGMALAEGCAYVPGQATNLTVFQPGNGTSAPVTASVQFTKAACIKWGGRLELRASREAECLAREACVRPDGVATRVPRSQCEDRAGGCGDGYAWSPLYEWWPAEWSWAAMLTAKTGELQWMQRGMVPLNMWQEKAVSLALLEQLLGAALAGVLEEAYVTEARCSLAPILEAYKPLACACGPGAREGRAAGASSCVGMTNATQAAALAEQTLFFQVRPL